MMLQPGDRIAGKYRIIRTLGTGGMGVVFLAQHERLERHVAIKVLHAHHGQSPWGIARFEREIKALALIKSPYVAQALDADILEDGSLYLVMEHLIGHDLRAETKLRGCIPPDEAVAYLIQACEGVAAAHDVGIVHRDLKPHNLFLTHLNEARQVKVLDFGIAKFLESADPSLTAMGMAVGTPLYMSPEQLCRPDEVSTRSDVWALGVVLYEIIVGTSPFAASAPGAVIAAVTLETPVAIRSIVPEVSEGLAEVIADALVKSHEHRIPSVRQLAERLKPFGMPSDAIIVPVVGPSQRPVFARQRVSNRPDISERIRAEVEAFDRQGGDSRECGTPVDALRQLPSLRNLSIPLTEPDIPTNRATRSGSKFGSFSGHSLGSTLHSQRGGHRFVAPSIRRVISSLVVAGLAVVLGWLGLRTRGAPERAVATTPGAIVSAPSPSNEVPSRPLAEFPTFVASATAAVPAGTVEAIEPRTDAVRSSKKRPVVQTTQVRSRKDTKEASTLQRKVESPLPVAPPTASDGKPLHL